MYTYFRPKINYTLILPSWNRCMWIKLFVCGLCFCYFESLLNWRIDLHTCTEEYVSRAMACRCNLQTDTDGFISTGSWLTWYSCIYVLVDFKHWTSACGQSQANSLFVGMVIYVDTADLFMNECFMHGQLISITISDHDKSLGITG